MKLWFLNDRIGRKALVLSVLSVVFSIGFNSLNAQAYLTPSTGQWLGNGGNLASGSYSNIGWSGTLTIPAGQTVTLVNPNFATGSLVVNGTLTVNGTQFNAGGSVVINGELEVINSFTLSTGYLQVNAGASLKAKNLYLANPNNVIEGTVIVSQTFRIDAPPTVFKNCGALYTNDFQNNSAANPISGNGFISISGTYTGANSLTQSSGITVAYGGSNGNFGTAGRSMSNPCSALPIKYVKGSFRLIKKSSKL